MIEVKVTVEIPGLSEAINALAGAIENNHPDVVCKLTQNGAQTVNAGTASMDVPAEVAANPTQEAVASVAAPTSADIPTAPEMPVAPSPAAEVAPPPAAVTPGVTMDVIGRAGAALVDAGKMPQLIALLGKYGVQAITQLKPEMLDSFAGELRALGAKI